MNVVDDAWRREKLADDRIVAGNEVTLLNKDSKER